MTDFITCPKCGEKNEKDRLFCWVCYTRFDGTSKENSTITASSEGIPRTTQSKEFIFKLVLFGLFLFLGVIILILMANYIKIIPTDGIIIIFLTTFSLLYCKGWFQENHKNKYFILIHAMYAAILTLVICNAALILIIGIADQLLSPCAKTGF
jgi:hypothetical protein